MIKVSLISAFLIALFVLTPPKAMAFDPLGEACKGDTINTPACQQNNKTQNSSTNTNPVVDTIHKAADAIALAAGLLAVIIIIYSGFQFITAGGAVGGGQRSGDSAAGAKKARATLTGAIIGLVIIALAWTIVNVVLNVLT